MDIEVCCNGDVVMLGPTTSIAAMILGVEGSGGAEDAGAVSNGAVVVGAGTEDART